jgi:tetratricopeptide (TPR) repeat protein
VVLLQRKQFWHFRRVVKLSYEKVTVSGRKNAQITSKELYVSLFQCALCTSLVSLDSVVSSCCSQPFCGACHAEISFDLASKNQCCRCSKCHDRLEVKQMQSSQPLSFKVLSSIQIACRNDTCSWNGRYDHFLEHVQVHDSAQLNSETDSEHSHGAQVNLDKEDVEETIVIERELLYKKADKLKKHANAKSNTGNILKARKLYTQGIDMLKDVPPNSESDCKLLSDMHANRAFTFFQTKNFDECIIDCESAIEYEPSLEKSWIRKWRALMAKGDFDESHQFLKQASLEIPESSKIQQAYSQSKSEMETYAKLKSFVDDYSMEDAEKAVREYRGGTENVVLLSLFANVMIAHGYSEPALKIVEKALEVNPFFIDCLELRGLCHFYSGKFEQGVNALSKGCKIINGNRRLESALEKVQNTSKLYSKGRLALKRCCYEEADAILTKAIDMCAPVPSKSLVYSMLTIESAKCLVGMMEYSSALNLCEDIIEVRREFAPAWIVRSEILMALGQTEEARKELHKIRCSWGSEDITIQLAYRKVDFELSVLKVNMDVLKLQENLGKGTINASFKSFEEKHIGHDFGVAVEKNSIPRDNDKRTRGAESDTEEDSSVSDILGEPNVIAKTVHRAQSDRVLNSCRSNSFRRLTKSKH